MAKPTAEDLKWPITLQRALKTRNGFNEEVETWIDIAVVGAKVTDATAGESYRAAEVGAQISARFTIRWSPEVAGVAAADRVLFNDRPYNITAVREFERGEWREIDAVARAEAST
jgi:SPP1 family predicted phage head-tail adaptor